MVLCSSHATDFAIPGQAVTAWRAGLTAFRRRRVQGELLHTPVGPRQALKFVKDAVLRPDLCSTRCTLQESVWVFGYVSSRYPRCETDCTMTNRVPAVLEPRDSSGDPALAGVTGTQPTLRRLDSLRPNTRPPVRNAILSRISPDGLAALGECLEPIVLKERMVLQEPKRHAKHVYFVESGLVSLRVVAAGSVLETAVIGSRGVVGASFLCGGHLSTHQSVVLFPGSAHRIRVEELRRLVEERPEIREHLFEYVQALTFQCVQTGLCGVRHDREQRLASWLCLASDAADVRVLPVTHDYLSSVLGLRRAGVTQTLSRFEERGLIRKMRGVLEIDEPKCLEKRACCCYKLISGAYASSQSAIPAKELMG